MNRDFAAVICVRLETQHIEESRVELGLWLVSVLTPFNVVDRFQVFHVSQRIIHHNIYTLSSILSLLFQSDAISRADL